MALYLVNCLVGILCGLMYVSGQYQDWRCKRDVLKSFGIFMGCVVFGLAGIVIAMFFFALYLAITSFMDMPW